MTEPTHPALQRLRRPRCTTQLAGALTDQLTAETTMPFPHGYSLAQRKSTPPTYDTPARGGEMLRLFDAYTARQAVIVNPRHSPMLDEVLDGTHLELRRAAVHRWKVVTTETLRQQATSVDLNGGEPAARPPQLLTPDEEIADAVAWSGAPARETALTILMLHEAVEPLQRTLLSAAQRLARELNETHERAAEQTRITLLCGSDCNAFITKSLGMSLAEFYSAATATPEDGAERATAFAVLTWAHAAPQGEHDGNGNVKNEPGAGDDSGSSSSSSNGKRQRGGGVQALLPVSTRRKIMPAVPSGRRELGAGLEVRYRSAIAPIATPWQASHARAFRALTRAVYAAGAQAAAEATTHGWKLSLYRMAQPYDDDGPRGTLAHIDAYEQGLRDCATDFFAKLRITPKLQLHPNLNRWYAETHNIGQDAEALTSVSSETLSRYSGNLVPLRTTDNPQDGDYIFVRLVPHDLVGGPDMRFEVLPAGPERTEEVARRMTNPRVVHGLLCCEAGKREQALAWIAGLRAAELRNTKERCERTAGHAVDDAEVLRQMGPFWLNNQPQKCQGGEKPTGAEDLNLHVVFVGYEVAAIDRHVSHFGVSRAGRTGTPLVPPASDTADLLAQRRDLDGMGGTRLVSRTYEAVVALGAPLLQHFYVSPCDRYSAFVDAHTLQDASGEPTRQDEIDVAESTRLTRALRDAVRRVMPLFQDRDELVARCIHTVDELDGMLDRASGPKARTPPSVVEQTRRRPDIHEDAVLFGLGLDRTLVRLGDAYTAVAAQPHERGALGDLFLAVMESIDGGAGVGIADAVRHAATAVRAQHAAQRTGVTADMLTTLQTQHDALAAKLHDAQEALKKPPLAAAAAAAATLVVAPAAASPAPAVLELTATARDTLNRAMRLVPPSGLSPLPAPYPPTDNVKDLNIGMALIMHVVGIDRKSDAYAEEFTKAQRKGVCDAARAFHARVLEGTAAPTDPGLAPVAHYLGHAFAAFCHQKVAKALPPRTASIVILQQVPTSPGSIALTAYELDPTHPDKAFVLTTGALLTRAADPHTGVLGWFPETQSFCVYEHEALS